MTIFTPTTTESSKLDLTKWTHVWVTNDHKQRPMPSSYLKVISDHFADNPKHQITLVVSDNVPDQGMIRNFVSSWKKRGYNIRLKSYEKDVKKEVAEYTEKTGDNSATELLSYIDAELHCKGGLGIAASDMVRLLPINDKGIYKDFDIKVHKNIPKTVEVPKSTKLDETILVTYTEFDSGANNAILAFEENSDTAKRYRENIPKLYNLFINDETFTGKKDTLEEFLVWRIEASKELQGGNPNALIELTSGPGALKVTLTQITKLDSLDDLNALEANNNEFEYLKDKFTEFSTQLEQHSMQSGFKHFQEITENEAAKTITAAMRKFTESKKRGIH